MEEAMLALPFMWMSRTTSRRKPPLESEQRSSIDARSAWGGRLSFFGRSKDAVKAKAATVQTAQR